MEIYARLQAVEELVRDDQGEDESFDYDEFIRLRNRVDAPIQPATFDEIRDQFKGIQPEPEVSRRKFTIDSDSEGEEPEPSNINESADEADDINENTEGSDKAPRRVPQIDSDDESDHDASPAANTDANADVNADAVNPKRQPPRKSRAAAEQELARIKRQLDTDISLHTKSKPSVADFLVSFRPNEPSDDSDLEIVSGDSCPTSPILPFKTLPDTRLKWFKNIQQLQSKQQARRMDENLKQFEIEEVVEESEEPEEEEEVVHHTPPSETPDAAQHELNEEEEEEVEEPVQMPSSPVVATTESTMATATQLLHSSNDTVVNETQVEAPIDPEQLRQLYQRQRRIFNDSDSEDEGVDSDVSDVDETPSIDRQELAKLSPAQQEEELRRRFQIKRELALELLEEQAQESDEDNEFPREQNGDTDEDDDEAPVENLIDDTKQQIQEEELHARYVEHEREMDEKIAKSLRKDVLGGGWRTKHLLKDGGMLDDDDSDDEAAEQFKRARRIQRDRIFEHSLIGKLAANAKTKAFAESMVDEYISNDTLEDSCESVHETLRFLSERQNELPSSQQLPSSQPQPEDPVAAPVVPLVVSERRSTGRSDLADRIDRSRRRDSVLSRALPSVHSVPVLANKHINRRARISAPQKPQKLSCKSIGLGYKRSWS